jgi:hypothetical protein
MFEDEIGLKFKRLNEIDASSSFFRYPTGKSPDFEKDKSAFKKTTVENVMSMANKNQAPMKSMKVMAFIGQETEVFVHDDSFTDEAMNMLSELVEEVSTFHHALMSTLGGGGIAIR